MDLREFAAEAEQVLGERLIALYQFGSSFARGPRDRDARLLMLVRSLDAALLHDVRPLAARARAANLQLRFDTVGDVVASADVFPIFTLELIDTKTLIRGADVLEPLAVHPEHLRLHVEQSLRSLHRALLVAYIEDEGPQSLSRDLRLNVRKSIYLLRAMGLVCGLAFPDTPSAETLIDTVIGLLLPDADRAIWHRLRRMASFEQPVAPEELAPLFAGALDAFSALVNAADAL